MSSAPLLIEIGCEEIPSRMIRSAVEDLADRLFISQKTVKNHLASIYEKLGVTDRAQAAVEAIRLGLHRDGSA